MKTILCILLLPLALVCGNANAGLKKKLLLGAAGTVAAVVVVGATLAPENYKELPNIQQYDIYNRINENRIALVLENSEQVGPNGIDQNIVRDICGPSAIFTSLSGTKYLNSSVRFPDYTSQVIARGNLSGGMKQSDFINELKDLSIEASMNAKASGEAVANRIIDALDEGKLVFANTTSGASFSAITGRKFPGRDRSHWIRPIAVKRNEKGLVTGVAVYDVNVYNGSRVAEAVGVPMKFINYDAFVRLLGARHKPISAVNAAPPYIISKKSIYPPAY